LEEEVGAVVEKVMAKPTKPVMAGNDETAIDMTFKQLFVCGVNDAQMINPSRGDVTTPVIQMIF